MKRDVRKPLAHGQSQNEIWEYLAQALGDRPLLSIYNHVKLLVAGDPIEASSGTPQPSAAAAEGAASAESTPGPGGANTDANAVASGSGSGAAAKGPTPKPNFAVAPGPSLEGVLGDANRKGRWTPEEDQSLARLLKEFGPSWNEIGRRLGRSGVACRDRWTKQLNNGLALGMTSKGESVPVQKAKEGKWSEAEVEQLRALHAEFGSQWKLISTKMGGTRTSTQCRTKWCVFFSPPLLRSISNVRADPRNFFSLSQDRLHRSSRSCRTRQGRSGSGGFARPDGAGTQGTRLEGRLALARERWFAPHPHVSRSMG